MKFYSPFLFILLACFISGCEDFSSSNKPQKITEESSKQSKKTKLGKKTSNKKQLNTSHKKGAVLSQSKIDQKNFNSNEQQNMLDLSLPFEIEKTTNFTGSKKQRYLPDLFATNNKKHPLQVGGKIIKKIEEETDKERTADGLGIDFNLSH